PQKVPIATPQAIPEMKSVPVPQKVPIATPQAIPEMKSVPVPQKVPIATPQAIPEMKSAPILAYNVPTIAKVIEIQISKKTKGTLTQDFKKNTVFVSKTIKDEGIDTDIFGEKKLSIYLEEKNIDDTKKVNKNQIIESLQSGYINVIRTNEALSSSTHSEDHNKINVLPKTGEIKSMQEGLSLMGFGLIMIAGVEFVGKKQKNYR
ncbi:LPXTG cell wall anchor domain-containing protein, partial [Enterococcus hirae]